MRDSIAFGFCIDVLCLYIERFQKQLNTPHKKQEVFLKKNIIKTIRSKKNEKHQKKCLQFVLKNCINYFVL